MGDLILVINAGSSSLKMSLFAADAGEPARLVSGHIDGIGVTPRFVAKAVTGETLVDASLEAGCSHQAAMRRLDGWLDGYLAGRGLAAIGHRVVHGGTLYSQPALIEPRVMTDLETLVPLAPLHQPHNLQAIKAMTQAYPGVPQVACFDTAFHRGHPWVADTFALPRVYYAMGLRRYGFHGLSYEHVARALAKDAPRLAAGRVVVAHLGNGASCCAIKAGRSVDSSMSFTPLDGLPMGTRSGQIDPGVLLHLLDALGMTTAEVADLLYRQSGLKGLSGISNDMRDLEASDAPAAGDAIRYFTYRLRREIGSLAAVLEGLDGLVFTAGIGEHAKAVRREVCARLAWLGLRLDEAANDRDAPVISRPDSSVEVRVMPTDEETMIALHALRLVAHEPAP